MSGYSHRQLRRCFDTLVAPHCPETDDRWLNDSVVQAVFVTCGNLSAAHALLARTGHEVPSLSTFARKVKRHMGAVQMGYAKDGSVGARAAQIYLPGETTFRAYKYLMDHTEIPVLVIPRDHRTAMRPWITVVMDSETRYVLSLVITFGTPGSEEVRACLAAAFIPRNASDDVTVVGGLPEMVAWDRGLEFLSDLITQSCLRLGVIPVAQPAFSPHLKGRLERFWRYFKENGTATHRVTSRSGPA